MTVKEILAQNVVDYFRSKWGYKDNVRICNCCRCNIEKTYTDEEGLMRDLPITVLDVVKVKPSEMKKWRNFGKASLEELKDMLNEDGLHLDASDEEIEKWMQMSEDEMSERIETEKREREEREQRLLAFAEAMNRYKEQLKEYNDAQAYAEDAAENLKEAGVAERFYNVFQPFMECDAYTGITFNATPDNYRHKLDVTLPKFMLEPILKFALVGVQYLTQVNKDVISNSGKITKPIKPKQEDYETE